MVESLSDLEECDRQFALERFRMLRPFLEGETTLVQIANLEGLSMRTARRWVARYRRDGLAGLARKARADHGTRHVSNQLVELVEGLALKRPRVSMASIHRMSARLAVEIGTRAPSYATVRSIVRQLEPALMMLAHDGTKAYSETFDLLHRREADAPNAVWQADHTELDIWIKDERGLPKKPWLTVILDDYSRAVAGYLLSFSAPSALHTSLALRQAIWRKSVPGWHVCGVPAQFYTDHGSDFTSRHLEQVAADLKMLLVFSGVGRPRGRGKVERFFETINQIVLSRCGGYAPPGTGRTVPKLTIDNLDREIESFVVADYNLKPHSATGVAPQARWDGDCFLPQMPDSLEQLDLLLLTVARSRRVHQDGIRFQGLRYIDLNLAAFVGEDVTIRYDPRDMSEIRIFHRNQFVCRAICQELAGQAIGLKEIAEARHQRRVALRQAIKDRVSLVDMLTRPVRRTTSRPRKIRFLPEGHSLKTYINE